MATRMEGPPLAARMRAEVADEVRELGELGLVTVQVGEDPASTIYLRRKHEAAQAAGITSDDRKLPEDRSEEHTSELQSQSNLVCRLLLEKKKKNTLSIHHAENITSSLSLSCR